ncbi:hypothetical protein NDU88_002417 [Pleurodeles waltl]|uniref:Uncharacterized protein n=1 Tax=Pleurodeles waltl TaxID=8319 RepID=A0AAV7SBJ8_PLEWA|nr:hypothetical protein NDU88_002417 [Pleurodeles waltl]
MVIGGLTYVACGLGGCRFPRLASGALFRAGLLQSWGGSFVSGPRSRLGPDRPGWVQFWSRGGGAGWAVLERGMSAPGGELD